jgi:hypothetical protein
VAAAAFGSADVAAGSAAFKLVSERRPLQGPVPEEESEVGSGGHPPAAGRVGKPGSAGGGGARARPRAPSANARGRCRIRAPAGKIAEAGNLGCGGCSGCSCSGSEKGLCAQSRARAMVQSTGRDAWRCMTWAKAWQRVSAPDPGSGLCSEASKQALPRLERKPSGEEGGGSVERKGGVQALRVDAQVEQGYLGKRRARWRN